MTSVCQIWYMCESIYIGNIQQTFNKIMDGRFSYILHLLKNRQKSDSFTAHFEQHVNSNTKSKYIRKYMTSKVVKQINMIGAMKTLMKPN